MAATKVFSYSVTFAVQSIENNVTHTHVLTIQINRCNFALFDLQQTKVAEAIFNTFFSPIHCVPRFQKVGMYSSYFCYINNVKHIVFELKWHKIIFGNYNNVPVQMKTIQDVLESSCIIHYQSWVAYITTNQRKNRICFIVVICSQSGQSESFFFLKDPGLFQDCATDHRFCDKLLIGETNNVSVKGIIIILIVLKSKIIFSRHTQLA